MSPVLLLALLAAAGPHTGDAGEALYLSGVDHRAAGRLDQALERLGEVVAEHPESPFAAPALLECGRIEEQRGDRSAARAAYEDLLARYPSHRLAREATTRLEALDRGDAQDEVEARYRAILAGFDPARASDAVAEVEELVAAHPTHAVVPEAECWLASQERQVGRWDEARLHVDRAMAADPEHDCIPRSLHDMGIDALNHGHLDLAERSFAAMGAHGTFGRQGAERGLALVDEARRARRIRRAAGAGLLLATAAALTVALPRLRRAGRRRGSDADR